MFLLLTFHRVAVISGLVIAVSLIAPSVSDAQQAGPQCKPAASVARVPELPEGSGVAASRRTPGRFWSHNDSGDPALIALNRNGRVAGRLQLSGAAVEDWEAVAVGACPAGSCIYVADIGDNDAERQQVVIYRIPEPANANGTAKVADVLRGTYPDGAHDAEALLVGPDGQIYIVTKGDTGPVSLYRFPTDSRGTTVRLERVGEPRAPRGNDRITDGSMSQDGRWIALRSTQAVTFYRAADLLAGNWREAARVPVTALGEPQGEGITFGSDGVLYLMSEGGGKKQPGMFARLACNLTQ